MQAKNKSNVIKIKFPFYSIILGLIYNYHVYHADLNP